MKTVSKLVITSLALALTGCASGPTPQAKVGAPSTPSAPAPRVAVASAEDVSAKGAFDLDESAPGDDGGTKGIFVETTATQTPVSTHPTGSKAKPPRQAKASPAARHKVASAPRPRPTAPVAASSSKPRYRGLSYWIERQGVGGSQRVTASTVFRSGDHIRLNVKSSMAGYLYAVAQGSSGRSHVIYPGGGNDVQVEPGHTYAIPSSGDIVFDDQAGNEVVWLFLSQYPLAEGGAVPGSVPVERVASADSYTSCGTKDLLVVPDSLDNDCGFKHGSGTKDLLVQDDAGGAQPAGYAVANADQLARGRMLSLRLVLRHQ